MDQERWVKVDGYPDYSVSSLGRLRRDTSKTCTKAGKILKTSVDSHGYRNASLMRDGVAKTIKVHRVVALSFVPNLTGRPTVNHIDGDKLNNSAANLEWLTHKEQIDHAISLGNHPAARIDELARASLDF